MKEIWDTSTSVGVAMDAAKRDTQSTWEVLASRLRADKKLIPDAAEGQKGK